MIIVIKHIIKIFIFTDLFIIFLSYFIENDLWLINTQIAFFSSVCVTIGSYIGYKKNILNRVETHVNYDDNYDEIDKMDDPYDLYSPEIEEQKELSKDEIKQIIKENKPKGNNIKAFIGGLGGMASVYRVFGYICVVFGFFYLNNNHLLSVIPYLIGFLIVPIASLIYSYLYSNKI